MFTNALTCLTLFISGFINESSGDCSYAQFCKDEICDGTGCTRGCKDGFYGPQCRYRCTGNCLNNRCNTSAFGAASCTDGCKDGFWGNRCISRCYHFCKRCHNDTSCSECDGFHYGPNCTTNCRGTCSVSGCYNDGTCRQDNHTADPCGSNCLLCDASSGSCKRCKKTYAGVKCEVYCGNCNGTCSVDGCMEGCSSGYRGPYCEDACSKRCSDNVCDQETGSCSKGCLDGYTGAICSKICPHHCLRNICHQHSGQCKHGCQNGYFGPLCKSVCENCFDDACNRSTGRCEYGCVDGNYGLDCNHVCSELCKSGRCQREDGACLKGTSGNSTPKPPLDATVSANVYLILASVGVFLLCVVAAGILMIRFCRSPCLNRLNRNNPPPSGRSLPDPPPLQTSKNMYSVIYEDQMDPSAQSLRSNTLTPPSRTPGLDRSNSLPLSKDDPKECVFSTSGEVLQMRSLCDTTPSEERELHSLCASPDPDGSTYESLSSSAPVHKQTTVPRPYITPITDDQPELS